MNKIWDCKIFDGLVNKKYKVNVEHKIFGKYEMKCAINGLIDDEESIGIIVHGKEIFCYKHNGDFNFIEEKDRVILSDSLMKIFIENIQ